MVEIVLVRHSVTAGNLLGRYIGSRTDEPLCEDGIKLLQGKRYPSVDKIYVSPMKRCMETAGLIWPELAEDMIVVSDFRECDFGEFENKNYEELDGNAAYQAWIDSNGTLPFPGGESTEGFLKRCQEAFASVLEEILEEESRQENRDACLYRAAAVVHGGTIMSIMERYGFPKKKYFEYQVKNACGFLLTPTEDAEVWNYRPIVPKEL